MYIDYNQMKKELEGFRANLLKEGQDIVRAEWLWLESQGVGRLEKRKENEIEVEKFVITNPGEFWKMTEQLNALNKYKFGQQEKLKDLAKTYETV